jgi:formylglycine-generating enzyme required for sulfatase activity/outer membrane protein assembly factor BamB
MGRRLTLPFALLAILGAIAGGYVFVVQRAELPARTIVGMLPAGERGVVLLTHAEESSMRWVELVSREGRRRWHTEITPLEVVEDGFLVKNVAGVVAGDRVVLVADDPAAQRYVVFALARDDGQLLWMRKLEKARGEFVWEPTTVVIPDGERVYLVHRGIRRTPVVDWYEELRIDGLGLDDGALLWSFVDPEYSQLDTTVWRLAEARLLVAKRRGARLLDGATGEALPVSSQDSGVDPLDDIGFRCAFPGGAVGGRNGGWLILDADGTITEGAGETRWSLEETRQGMGYEELGGAPCGLRGDRVIFQAKRFDEREFALFAVDRRSGELVWRLPLGGECLGPSKAPAGLLARFVPLLTNCRERNAVELVVVDFEHGAIVERVPFGYAFALVAATVSTSERSWVLWRSENTLLGVHPETGELGPAVRFSNILGAALDVESGVLYLESQYSVPPERQLAAFDMAEGRILHATRHISAETISARDAIGDDEVNDERIAAVRERAVELLGGQFEIDVEYEDGMLIERIRPPSDSPPSFEELKCPKGMAKTPGRDNPALAPFCIGETMVTAAEYGACVDAGRCSEPYLGWTGADRNATYGDAARGDYPMNYVEFEQAATYCAWIGGLVAAEDEWLWAYGSARESLFPWGDDIPTRVDVCSVDLGSRQPPLCQVRSHPQDRTEHGVYDMAGGLDEYVRLGGSAFPRKLIDKPAPPPHVDLSVRVISGGRERMLYDVRSDDGTAKGFVDSVLASGSAFASFRCVVR